MWTYNGKRIREGRAWTDDNGVQHPANWHVWTEDEKIAHGLVWIVPQTKPDERFYWFSQNADGTYTTTPKALEDTNEVDENGDPVLDENDNQLVTRGVKWNLKQEVKKQQADLLSQTDWAIVRKADNDTAVPANIQTWRNSIRTKATEMETAIDNAADTDAIADLFVTYTTNEDGSVTKSGVLYDWPELGN